MPSLAPPVFSQRRAWAVQQSISYLMQQALENPGLISLAAGFVDPNTLPVDLVREVCHEVLSEGRSALQYGTTQGNEGLRRLLLEYLAKLEGCPVSKLGVSADQIVLTTGSQQLLSILCESLLDPGDIALVAAPTYFVFLGALKGVGAQIVAVETDQQGMIPEALEQTLRDLEAQGKLSRVRLVYLVSYFENPSGVSISAARRPQLVEIVNRWSRKQRIHILEDAAYRELRYSGPEFPSLWSFDEGHENVILAQTFSKSLSPGLRVGWSILPKHLVSAVCDRKGNEDFGSSNLNQAIVKRLLERGELENHVPSVRDGYRKKREAMKRALERDWTGIPGLEWSEPDGGLYFWVRVPQNISTGFGKPLFLEAVANQVLYVPGELFYPEESPLRRTNEMRLCFGVVDEAQIAEGMQRLATALRKTSEE